MTDVTIFEGKVCWFNAKAGYGFIEWDKNGIKQKDIFIHFSDLNCSGFKTIKKDQRVTFSLGLNNRGQIKAINVTAQ